MVPNEIVAAQTETRRSASFWFDRLVGGLELLFAILGLVPVGLMAFASYDEGSRFPGLDLPLWQGCVGVAVLLVLHVGVGMDLYKGRRRGLIGLLVLTLAALPFAFMAGSLVLIVPSLLLVAACGLRLGGWGPRPV